MTKLLEQHNERPDQSTEYENPSNRTQSHLINLKIVCQMTSLSRTYVNRLRTTGCFPSPVNLGERRIAFVKSEIEAWIEARIAERDGRAA